MKNRFYMDKARAVLTHIGSYVIIVWHIFCGGCSQAETGELVEESRLLLHTFIEIKAWGEGARQAIQEAYSEMDRVNALLNSYDPNSEVSIINKNAGGAPVQISAETMEALRLAKKFAKTTEGSFDCTIGPLVTLWGFDRDFPGLPGREPDHKALAAAKGLVDYRELKLAIRKKDGSIKRTAMLAKPGMWIDVGSFSKGYAADQAMKVLKQRGITQALIAAGGTICTAGSKPDGSPWRVGIRHPRKEGSFLTVLTLQDKSVSTSGDYEKYYVKKGKRHTHIIDPRTGLPVEKIQAVTVIADSGVVSDILSTALFVLGPHEGIQLVESLPGVEALLVDQQGKISYSKSWPQKTIIY